MEIVERKSMTTKHLCWPTYHYDSEPVHRFLMQNESAILLTRENLHPTTDMKDGRWLEENHENQTHDGEKRSGDGNTSKDCSDLKLFEMPLMIASLLFRDLFSPEKRAMASPACLQVSQHSCRSFHSAHKPSTALCGHQSLTLNRLPILQSKLMFIMIGYDGGIILCISYG